MTAPSCPYCGNPARLVGGRAVYPHRRDLAARRYWFCQPCGAWAGVNAHGKPIGLMANAERRKARADAHAAFDPLWTSGLMSRSGAYRWLAEELGLPKSVVHFAQFDEAMCRRVVAAVANREPRAAE